MTKRDRRGPSATAARAATGIVASDKMQKTVTVVLERRFAHPDYGKQVTRTKKVKAHDEDYGAKAGDTVRIMETRPLAKTVRWRVDRDRRRAKWRTMVQQETILGSRTIRAPGGRS